MIVRTGVPLATSERLMPVLPDVPSTMVPPSRSRPRRSASSTIPLATRSLELPPGFKNSAFACIRMVHHVNGINASVAYMVEVNTYQNGASRGLGETRELKHRRVAD